MEAEFSSFGIDSNNYNKVQRFHVTLKGHLIPPSKLLTDVSKPIKNMFYCFEVGSTNNNPHTHVCIEFQGKFYNFKKLKEYFQIWLQSSSEVPEELRAQHADITVHRYWEPMYGYHHGFSKNKPIEECCVTWLVGQAVKPLDHAKRILAKGKKAKSAGETAAVNKIILSGNLAEMVDEGLFPIEQLPKYYAARELYWRLKENVHEYIKWVYEGKQRHLWVQDKPNTGKTTMCEQLGEHASVYWKDLSDAKYWEQYTGQQFIVLNDFSGSISVSMIKNLTDGLSIIGVKGGSTKLYKRVVFIVTSNFTMAETFAKHFETRPVDEEALKKRFISINGNKFYEILHHSLSLIPCRPLCRFHPDKAPQSLQGDEEQASPAEEEKECSPRTKKQEAETRLNTEKKSIIFNMGGSYTLQDITYEKD